jgi:hypothetical protein
MCIRAITLDGLLLRYSRKSWRFGLLSLLLALLPLGEASANVRIRPVVVRLLKFISKEISRTLLLDDPALHGIRRVFLCLVAIFRFIVHARLLIRRSISILTSRRFLTCTALLVSLRIIRTVTWFKRRLEIAHRENLHQPSRHGVTVLGGRTFGEQIDPARLSFSVDLAIDRGSVDRLAAVLVGLKIDHRAANKSLLHVSIGHFVLAVVVVGRVCTLRRDTVCFSGFLATRRNLRGNALLGDIFFAARIVALGHDIASVLVTFAKVALGNRDLAMRAVSKLDASVTASKVGADQFFTVLHVFGDNKVRSL